MGLPQSPLVACHSRDLLNPFLVVATQNSIEQEGTYPLPEAQLDRFMFSLHLTFDFKVVVGAPGS
jgi:MoxR-like ATPase